MPSTSGRRRAPRESTLKQIGEASAGLKDFLSSLNAGSSSPLSLRQQEAAAREALNPYLGQIDATQSAQAEVDRLKASGGSAADIAKAEEAARLSAGKIDQEGFQSAAQTLLGISRSMNGSSGAFFDQFDRIKTATGMAISLIDKATTVSGGSTADPFAQATADNTKDIVALMVDNNNLLKALNDNLAAGGVTQAVSSWVQQQRSFV